VTLPVTVTVLDADGDPQAGLPVYAFDGDTYTGFSGTTDDLGYVPFTLPEGSYRFRADLLGTQFWSDEVNQCDVPGCESVSIEVTPPLVVTVLDTDGAPNENLPVYAFDGETYTGFNTLTNASGEATFVLPIGSYRFRSDLNGTQFWSGEANHCDVPGCVAAFVTVTIPVTVSVQDQAGTPYPELPVYAFTGETYTGFNGTSDAEGNVIFTLPTGDYRFRADLDGVQFWSGEVTTCTIPGCTEDAVTIPGGTVETDVTIDYTYDPLYRLTAADYSTGEFFHYTYDAVGNRLTQETGAGTNTYTYDIANRLTSTDGVPLTWDANGNLLSDGASSYSYDPANRLRTVDQGATSYTFIYDGLGNRVAQYVTGGADYDYTLDLAAGLTQVLDDGTNTYLYGRSRIGEQQPEGWQYHLGDALGSVRELTASTGTVGLARSYEPFGRVMATFGSDSSAYSFTGEQMDGTGLTFLRARYLATYLNQWIQPDPIVPDPYVPADWNRYAYVRNNPVNRTDPLGQCIDADLDGKCDWWPRSSRSQPPPAVPVAAANPLSVFDLVYVYADCVPRPSVYQHVVAIEIRRIEQRYGVHLGVHEINGKKGEWRLEALGTVENALATVDTRLRLAIDTAVWRDAETGRRLPLPPAGEMFKRLFSPLDLLRGPIDMKFYPGHNWFGKAEAGRRIYLYGLPGHWQGGTMFEIMLHELGHILDQRVPNRYSGTMNRTASLSRAIANIQDQEYYPKNDKDQKEKETIGRLSGLGVNQRSGTDVGEIWADLFASWAYNSYADQRFAPAWRAFVDSLMSEVATTNAVER
jgi:RHS repeat-associated protein